MTRFHPSYQWVLSSILLLLLWANSISLHAQGNGIDVPEITEEELAEQRRIRDSIHASDEATQERLMSIAESGKINDRVVVELDKNRFKTLARTWWGMPTSVERQKIEKGRYDRYQIPEGNEVMLARQGRVYRERKQVDEKQNVVVWGWHPYWAKDAFQNYNFDLLTHIAFYSYDLNPFTGGYKNFEAIYDFKSNELIPMALEDTVKVLLTVSCHRSDASEIFFTSTPKVRQNLIDSLKSILYYSGGMGIDINFEEVPAEFKQDFLAFVKELSYQLREENPNYTIAMTLPLHDRENVFDIGFLQNWVDIFVVSGFNFHLRETGVDRGPVSPLFNESAPNRGTYVSYRQYTNLDSVLRSGGQIQNIDILHNDAYVAQLLDTLNAFIRAANIQNVDYNVYDIGSVISVIKATPILQNLPNVRRVLRRTAVSADISKNYQPKKNVNFFLFRPEYDTVVVNEFDVFNTITGVTSTTDTITEDINDAIDRYVAKIGSAHSTSLVLGLPYYGAVWHVYERLEFEGYMPYAQIRQLIKEGRANVRYDKLKNSMVAEVKDTNDIVIKEIYFDNSTSLSKKMDLAMNRNMGGVAVWALSFDHGYNELWRTLEQQFAARVMWNPETETYTQFRLEKSNKIHYTIAYQLRRNSNLIFATLVFITIFMTIGFAFSLLDWRVRDVMFYSGAFRIFYLAIFTALVLLFGSYLGLFQNRMIAFLIGLLLGGILTWFASMLVAKRHEKLP